MQDKLDAICEKLENLSRKINDLEERVSGLYEETLDEMSGIVFKIEKALAYEGADVPDYSNENIIILHSSCFRTSALVKACCSPCKSINDLTGDPGQISPDQLAEKISRTMTDTHFILSSDIFARSDGFEKVILNAVTEGEAYFAIVTDDIWKIPDRLRNIMRLVQ